MRRTCPVPTTRRPPWPVRVRATVSAPFGRYLSRQAARPRGPFGRLLGRIWLRETAAVNDVTLDLLAPAPGERIGEIGFGPGRTLGLLAAAGAEVVGVEVSPTMLAVATRRNAGPVADGTMALHQGDGTTLPWPDDDLDAVLSVHTFHFWPDPAATLADIARVLRPGSRLVLTAPADDHPLPARFDTDVYRVSSLADATDVLRTAGFVDVRVERRPDIATTVWFTATAT